MTLILFVVILSILVFVHELGHFWVAKKNGILVEEFGFGLPPRIWGKKVGETIYSINALPIGGFVKLYGEDGVDNGQWTHSIGSGQAMDNGQSRRAFFAQSKLVRAMVLLAGVTMNFLLGVVLFSVIYTITGVPTPTGVVEIVDVAKDSPADAKEVKAGDKVLSINGVKPATVDEFRASVQAGEGRTVTLVLGRSMETYGREIMIDPVLDPDPNIGWKVGVVVSSVEAKHFPWWQMPFRGAWFGLQEALAWGQMILNEVGGMVGKLLAGIIPDVGGPLRIYQVTGEVAKEEGILPKLQFLAILSINLAILNVLPLPALDGGRLFFLGIETIFRRRVHARFEQITHAVGMIVLLTLMVLITINDIVQMTGSGNLWGLVQKITPL